MSDETPRQPGLFDVRVIKHLVALMDRHGVSEIDLHEGDRRIRLRSRQEDRVEQPGIGAVPPQAILAPTTVSAPAPLPLRPEKPGPTLQQIMSSTPGSFYASPSPDSGPFVQVGSRVTRTTVVGIIEAMKIFNEITADCAGVIREVLVKNQQPVEFGQVLFQVDPEG